MVDDRWKGFITASALAKSTLHLSEQPFAKHLGIEIAAISALHTSATQYRNPQQTEDLLASTRIHPWSCRTPKGTGQVASLLFSTPSCGFCLYWITWIQLQPNAATNEKKRPHFILSFLKGS